MKAQTMYKLIMAHPQMQAIDQWFEDNFETAPLSVIHEMESLYQKTYDEIEREVSA